MGNVLRVLGIVAASMLLGLVGLFLLLFSICGGLQSADGAGVLAVCLVLIAAAIALIVFLGRGLAASRSAARGLAVAPVVAPPVVAPTLDGMPMITPPSPYGTPSASPLPPSPSAYASPSPGYVPAAAAASVPPARPTLPLRPLAGTDLQVLMGLRIALAVYILLSLGSLAFNVASFNRFGSTVAIQLILRGVLSLLPPAAVLVALSLRNPPAGAALDAVAGMGIASILFRFGFLAVSGFFVSAAGQVPGLGFLVMRLGAYSALEAALAGMALHLRSRVAPLNPGALIVATVAFLFWDGLVQAAMQALTLLMY
ncbi:MAG: hypothetical protein ABIT71_09055 [Vicinamibacteraceae bacterium]